jgi:hypothetical protein
MVLCTFLSLKDNKRQFNDHGTVASYIFWDEIVRSWMIPGFGSPYLSVNTPLMR